MRASSSMASPSDDQGPANRQPEIHHAPRSEQVRASLFVTCIVDQFYPPVGESAVRVLRGLGVDVDFPEAQTCCGQPAFNAGFTRLAADAARRLLVAFRGGRYVVAPSGSCAAMVKIFYPELLRDEPENHAEARQLADRTYEFSQFIVDVLGRPYPFDRTASQQPNDDGGAAKVTYHEGCHLRRELGAVWQPRSLVRSLPGVELVEMEYPDECCGFGGTFSVKFADISGAMLADKLDRIEATGADAVVACDSSCLMQIEGGLRKRGSTVQTLHLAQLLDSRAVFE